MSATAKAALTAALAGALLAAATLLLSAQAPEPGARAAEGERPALGARAPASRTPRRAAEAPAAALAAPAPLRAPAAKAPGSLRGTEPDGPIEADASGHLVLGPGVLRFFDYFLTAEGEESDEALRARLLGAAQARLPASAVGELQALLARYLRYRDAGRSLGELGGDPEQVHARLRALRREQLGEREAAALFAEDEALDAAALARRKLAEDASLTPAQRAAAEAQLEAQLPSALQKARAAATLPLRLDAEEAAMRAAGATAGDLRAVREQASGPEAAARLAELDRARAEWDGRVRAFRERKAALEAAESDPTARAGRAQALLEELFSPAERLRVHALDRLARR